MEMNICGPNNLEKKCSVLERQALYCLRRHSEILDPHPTPHPANLLVPCPIASVLQVCVPANHCLRR
jgi:hypothetical protein